MKKLISCEFNIDTASVEVKYTDGSMISIYCPGVDDLVAKNWVQRTELDWLIYNEPLTYHQDQKPKQYHDFENVIEEELNTAADPAFRVKTQRGHQLTNRPVQPLHAKNFLLNQ